MASEAVDPTIPAILPVGREWIISLCDNHGHIEAYDAETLVRIFSGHYFSSEEYRGRDPRRWSKRQVKRLINRYGIYGGSRHDGTIFVLAEVAALVALLGSVDEEDARELRRMRLSDALTAARDAYGEFMIEQAERTREAL